MANETPAKPTYLGLRILLNVVGALCLLGVAIAFLPVAWLEGAMAWWARVTGVDQLGPFSPVFWYGLRAFEIVFLGVAWMSFAAARDPERHRDFIHAVMVTLVAWVLLCPIFGYGAGLPTIWYLGDSLEALVLLVLLVALYPRRRAAPAPA